ncbi:hypothetical protein SAMN05443665_106625 [Actinomadura meyerae]|uniref:Uncharacterized protein n=1 Tax=Actinomadura meyerae TaxID=240840 RepID=A0A239P489_9ACTN|nr:hypothetical protein [Actinomadura meyerae]SNT61850.1 hypothetical protein SAMN05443665_106625 [Actinomadura meyerae]
MITVLVLVSLLALFGLCLPRLLRPMPSRTATDPPPPEAAHPESMTAELDPGDEEYLAALADELWPEDEYLELEPTTDGEEEPGGSGMRR